jgi:hypothetical protein
MKRLNVLGSLALAAALGGCYVSGQAQVTAPAPQPVVTVQVDEAPPAPQYEAVAVRPGFVWIGGHWFRRGGRWEWRGGYFEPERDGYSWAPGRWEIRGNRHVWIEGGWHERRREVIVR